MLIDDHIVLRAVELSDVDTLYRWENDEDSRRISQSPVPYSKQTIRAYVQAIRDIYADRQLRLIIEDRDTGVALGAVDLFDCDFKNRRAGIGILIARSQDRHRGMGSRVLGLLLPYSFNTLGLHQLYCDISVDNKPSLALFGKFGFERCGLKKQWNFVDGRFTDVAMMQKIADHDKN